MKYSQVCKILWTIALPLCEGVTYYNIIICEDSVYVCLKILTLLMIWDREEVMGSNHVSRHLYLQDNVVYIYPLHISLGGTREPYRVSLY